MGRGRRRRRGQGRAAGGRRLPAATRSASAKLGAKVPKGILLHGPPGTGKTLLAKAVANESGAQFFAQSAASFVEMFAGLGAARIRRLFDEARKHAPAIVFIDEIDAVGAARGSDNNSEREQTLNQLLVEMDGFATTGDLVVIAASNLLEKLDPALLRPGRFDRQILVSPPDVGGREAILKVHTRNKPLSATSTSTMIARQTVRPDRRRPGQHRQRGGDRRRAAACARGSSRRDFDYALERVVAGMQSRRALTEHERRVIAFHEAGHALCAELLPGVDRTHKVSIVPRGTGARLRPALPGGGPLPQDAGGADGPDDVLLGGRAAEELVFGSVTTGASDDLKQVAAISRAMIHEWAMGTSVSALQLAAEGGAVSDRTRELRDAEQQHLADEAMRRAVQAAHRPPRAARPARRRAAAPRGARARGHRAHHGRRPDARGASARRRPAGRGRRADERPAGFLSVQVPALRGRSPRDAWERADDFRALLEPGAIRAVFQPIVRLSDLGTIGYEGLARFPTPPGLVALPPDVTLAAAARAGLRDDLEVACWSAIAAAGVPPHGRLLWVNLSPEALGHPGLLELAGRLPSRLVIELTEQDTVLNHALLRERLRPWIARGALVAVDDAGAGFTSLEYVADIRPDFLKLSRGDGRRRRRRRDPRGRAARHRRVRARGRRARRGRGRRARRRSSRRCARWRSTTARAGSSAARARRGRADARPPPAAPCRARGQRAARARPRARRARPATRARRSSTTSPAAGCCRRSSSPRTAACAARPCAASGRSTTGCPPTAGIVGRVFRTGVAAVVDDVGDAPDYLPAVPGVRAEVCLPLRAAGQVVGVLDAESLTAIDAADASPRSSAARRCCPRGWRRSARVGAASPAQRLARIAARLASTEDPEGVVREALAGRARALRLRVRRRRPGRRPRRAVPASRRGPVRASPSASSTPRSSPRWPSWVDEGTSTYTVGDTAGRGFAGHEVLRRAGVGSLIVLPLSAGRRAPRPDRGRRPREPPPGLRGHRAARAARAAGRERPADGDHALPAARARLARPADRPARFAAAAAAPRRRRCSSTSTASARSTATAARPRATTSCAPPPACCAS